MVDFISCDKIIDSQLLGDFTQAQGPLSVESSPKKI